MSLLACDVGYAGITAPRRVLYRSPDGPGFGRWSDRHDPPGATAPNAAHPRPSVTQPEGSARAAAGNPGFWWLRPPRGEADQFLTGRANPKSIDDVGR